MYMPKRKMANQLGLNNFFWLASSLMFQHEHN